MNTYRLILRVCIEKCLLALLEWTGQLQFAIVSNITKIEDLFVFGKGGQAGPKGVTVNMNLVNSNLISMTIRVSWDTSIHLKTFF